MQSLEEEAFLKYFGLTDIEAKLFIELIRLGKIEIGGLIKSTGLHRGTTYNSIQRMETKGLVSKIKNENKTFYSVSDSAFLSNIMEDKIRLDEKEKIANEIHRQVKINKQLNPIDEDDAQVSHGKTAIKNAILKTINDTKISGNDISMIAKGGSTIAHCGIDFYKSSEELKDKQKIHIDLLGNASSKTNDDFVKNTKGTKVKWLPAEFEINSSLRILDQEIVLTEWNSNPPKVTVLKSKEFVEMHKSIFNELWKKTGMEPEELK